MGTAIVLMIRTGVMVLGAVVAFRGEETKAITTPLGISVMMDRAVTNNILQYIIIIVL